MKYMLWPTSPRRTTISPACAACDRNSRMIAATSSAVRSANSGTRAIIPQVTTKSRRWITSENGVRDDADRQRDHGEAEERRRGRQDLAQRRDRHDVAIAHRGQRDDRPPHRIRDGAELVGLGVALHECMRDAVAIQVRPE